MAQSHLPAVFMRGGTSNAVVFKAADLPGDRALWDPIFLGVMGSPDPYGRQLDGMGGGISSLSKICVVAPPSRDDADVDYTFAQIPVDGICVDYSANCGNMSSAIGPFAVDEELVPRPADGEACVRIHNTNTGKIILSRFRVRNGAAEVDGDLAIDGVAGTSAPIRLEFADPGGARTGRLLPTGKPVDRLAIEGLGTVEASLVDAANPCVFVAAEALGKCGDESPDVLEADSGFLMHMEAIRRAASVAMGLSRDAQEAATIASVPKVAIVTAPRPMRTLSGTTLAAGDHEIGIRMISIGRPHRAVPITGATCLAVAARIPGSLPNQMVAASDGPIRIAHPSGVVVVDAAVSPDPATGEPKAGYGAVLRTARRLFKGVVYYRQIMESGLQA